MPTDTVLHIVKLIKQLSPAEKEQLRSALEPVLPDTRPHATEVDFHQALTAAGVLSSPSAQARAQAAPWYRRTTRSISPPSPKGSPLTIPRLIPDSVLPPTRH